MSPLLLVLLLFMGEGAEAPQVQEETEAIGLHEIVVVTASAQQERLVDAAAPVSVVSRRELGASPNVVLDTQLRQVPGFSLFRRNSSLDAHPTTQGVSLRGLGASGASRSLVLLDGMPVNDPFGGWVYWNRIPVSSLDSVEVVRGATSQLYGSSAMAGAIQLLTRQPSEGFVEVAARGGSRGTWDVEGVAGGMADNWSYLAAGRALDTNGYVALRPEDRGEIDGPIALGAQSAYARAQRGGLRIGGHAYWEKRQGATPIQGNDSRLFAVDAGYTAGAWKASAYAQNQRLRSRFSRVLPGRDAEVPTADQEFPSWALGAALSRQLQGNVLLGADWRRVAWDEHDQNLAGLYVQKLAAPRSNLDLQLGVRLDLWENDALQATLSPRFGVVYRPSTRVTLRGSVYRGFRAPTLNELHRPFRVGSVETLANPALVEERLLGAEAGVDFHPSPSLLLRLNGFWSRLDDAIGNATIEITSTGTLRQRQNLGRTPIRGLEAESRVRWAGNWWGRAAYLFSASNVEGASLQLPQSPQHQASLGLSYDGNPRLLVQGRWIGNQYEDDLNELALGDAVVIDASLGVQLTSRLELTLSVENLLDRANIVGRTPLDQLDIPRTLLAGLRFR